MNLPLDSLTVPALTGALREHDYIADRGLATSLLLALKLGKPLLLEGEVGVGKTELAKTLASMLDRELIRLQCYEGIESASGSGRGSWCGGHGPWTGWPATFRKSTNCGHAHTVGLFPVFGEFSISAYMRGFPRSWPDDSMGMPRLFPHWAVTCVTARLPKLLSFESPAT